MIPTVITVKQIYLSSTVNKISEQHHCSVTLKAMNWQADRLHPVSQTFGTEGCDSRVTPTKSKETDTNTPYAKCSLG